MTEHPFPARFGRPDPSVPNGVHYTYRGNKRFWQRKMLPVTGAGWF